MLGSIRSLWIQASQHITLKHSTWVHIGVQEIGGVAVVGPESHTDAVDKSSTTSERPAVWGYIASMHQPNARHASVQIPQGSHMAFRRSYAGTGAPLRYQITLYVCIGKGGLSRSNFVCSPGSCKLSPPCNTRRSCELHRKPATPSMYRIGISSLHCS